MSDGPPEPSPDDWVEREPLDVPTGVIDFARSRFLRSDGKILRLTTREAQMLAYLSDRPNNAVARDRLLVDVWGHADDSLSRAVDTAMARLRPKLEMDVDEPITLQTVHGHGYRLCLRTVAPTPARAPASAPRSDRRLMLGTRTLDLGAGYVETTDDRRLRLSGQERALIEVLLRADGAAVDAERLARKTGIVGGRAALRNAIYRLRQKLEQEPSAPQFLCSVHGGGYRLDAKEPTPLPATAEHVTALRSLTDHLGLVHGLTDCVVYIRQGDRLQQVAAFGPKRAPDGGVVEPLNLGMGEGVVGTSAASGHPELVTEVHEEPRYVRDLHPARSELSVPVMFDGAVVGVIDSEAAEPGRFSDSDRAVFVSLAAIAAPAFPSAGGPHG